MSKVKKKSKVAKVAIIVTLAIALICIGIFVFFIVRSKVTEERNSKTVANEETSGYLLSLYSSYLNSFNTDALSNKDFVSKPYVGSEYVFINNSDSVSNFLKWVCKNSSFKDLNTTDRLSETGESSVVVSVTLESVDYSAISATISSDSVADILESSNVSSSDIDIQAKLYDLFCSYITSLEEVPKINTSIQVVFEKTEKLLDNNHYAYKIQDDLCIDNILFGSESLHNLQDEFAKVAINWTGFKTEKYIEAEEQENPEYVHWLEMLNAEIEKFPKWSKNAKCLYEPFYKKDEKGKTVRDENNNKVVDYYILYESGSNGKKIKDSSSQYGYKIIPQPDKTIMVDVDKEREVEDKWVNGLIFPYNLCGCGYVLEQGLSVRLGDGSWDNPAGEGTSLYTKVVTDSGVYDICISLVEEYNGEDAVAYAIKRSEKNRGLDSNSVVKIVICEFKITNISNTEITISPDMVLTDEFGNKLPRTGTIYGLTDTITLQSGETGIVSDWVCSTDLPRYKVAWGNSFDVSIPFAYFSSKK